MPTTTFDPNDPRLTSCALGELHGDELTEFERLLAESAVARDALVEIRETTVWLRDELAAERPLVLTAEQHQRLEQHLAPARPLSHLPTGLAPVESGFCTTEAASSEAASSRVSLSSDEVTQENGVVQKPVHHRDKPGGIAASIVSRQQRTRHRWAVLAAATAMAALSAAVMLWPATSPRTSSELLAMRDSPSVSGLPEGRVHYIENDFSVTQDGVTPFRTLDDGLADHTPHPVVLGAGEGRNAAFVKSSQPEPDGFSAEAKVSLSKQESARDVRAARSLSSSTQPASSVPVVGLAASSGERGVQAEYREKLDSGVTAGTTRKGFIKPGAAHPFGLKPAPVDAKPSSSDAAPSARDPVSRFSVVDKEGRVNVNELKNPIGLNFVSDVGGEAAAATFELKEKLDLVEQTVRVVQRAKGKPITPLRTIMVTDLDALVTLNTKDARAVTAWYEKATSGQEQFGTEAYAAIHENPFLTPAEQPLSTFSVDVDTASYANVRRFLNQRQLPPADAVRIEELVNYFKYDDPAPVDGQPFAVKAEAAPCPWQREHYVARISLKAREIAKAQRPPTNLVFLLDVSGSMQAENKLALVKRAMSLLVEELGEKDRVSIVTYAGDAGLKLEPTVGSDQTKIMQAIEALSAGGSTNGAAGIQLAYEQALRHFNKDSANRVILCTDGDFNVGVSSDEALVNLIEQQAKSGVFLSIFGFGMGNLKDSKLEKLADKGNGHYGYIDDLNEARKNFNEELMGTLYTVAKDVKLQIEFNPLTVGAYRLIGYENRVMAAEDFNNDAKDAGEIGAGHTVTALYEIVPRGKWKPVQPVDPLKYTATEPAPKAVEQKGNVSPESAYDLFTSDLSLKATPIASNVSPESADDLFTVKLRYKQPDAVASVRTVDVVVDDIAGKKVTPSRDLLWSASVASFGMQLRHSQHAGTWTMADVLETARGAKGDDTTGRRGEFVELVKATMKLMPSPQSDPQSKKPAVGF